jgi:hypothetical protein
VAADVTRTGREIIRAMLDWLRKEGATPVEIDTDGIYFVPPPGVTTEKEAEDLVARLSDSLPEGIEVGMDGLYPAMFSYKMKNYALLDEKGRMLIKGSALRSRGMEKFLRDFLSEMLHLLLEGKGEKVRNSWKITWGKSRSTRWTSPGLPRPRPWLKPRELHAEGPGRKEKPGGALRACPGIGQALQGRGSALILCDRFKEERAGL